MIFLKIDTRERELISLINSKNKNKDSLVVEVETLSLGDAILSKDGVDLVMIERKSIKDLVSSIKDGRYSEQSYRLNGTSLHNHNIIYLIEGDITKTLLNKQMIYSSLFSLNYCKGFSVIRTFSLDETASFILNMAEYLGNPNKKGAYYSSKRDYYADAAADSDASANSVADDASAKCIVDTKYDEKIQVYSSVVKSVKKENITLNNIGEIMLSQIPGVSNNSAIAIMAQFKNLVNLIADLQEQGEECLKSVIGANNKRLNKTCIANVAKYLLCEESDIFAKTS